MEVGAGIVVQVVSANAGRGVPECYEPVRFGVGQRIQYNAVEQEFAALKASPRRIGAPATPVPYNAALESAYIPGEKDIAAAIGELIES